MRNGPRMPSSHSRNHASSGSWPLLSDRANTICSNLLGDKRDEGVTPEPKDRLRSVLKEALERIDEEEILDFLKASLYFRLKFCLHAPFLPHTKQDIASKPPYTTPEKTRPSTSSSSSTAPSTIPTTGTNTTETEKSTELNDMPDLPEEDLENALESISRRNEIPAPHFDDAPTDELARDDPQVPINGHDLAVQPAELEGLENHRDLETASLAESISDNDDLTKLSESLLNSKESTAIEETNENDGLIDTASDRVGKAPVREETESAEIMTANSDVGEFDSVITIDYNALEDEEKMETGTGGVDLGPVFEPNEQMSL